MMLIILLAIALVAVAASFTVTHVSRRRDTPRELRGDWWPQFEQQFRAYAARQTSARRGQH